MLSLISVLTLAASPAGITTAALPAAVAPRSAVVSTPSARRPGAGSIHLAQARSPVFTREPAATAPAPQTTPAFTREPAANQPAPLAPPAFTREPAATAPAPLAAPPTVTASTSLGAAPENRGLSVWLGFPYSYGGFGFGLGARMALPLAIPSLIRHPRIRDNWALEFGADYYRYSVNRTYDYSVSWFLPVAGIMWNVWLNEKFAVYPKAEAGWTIAWVSGYPSGGGAPGYGGPFIAAAAGLIYKVSDNFALRAEAGTFGLKGGVAFVF